MFDDLASLPSLCLNESPGRFPRPVTASRAKCLWRWAVLQNLIRLINQSLTVCAWRGHDHAQRHARRILTVMVPTERDIPTPQALMDVLLPRGGFAKLLPRKIGIAAVDTNGAAIDARVA